MSAHSTLKKAAFLNAILLIVSPLASGADTDTAGTLSAQAQELADAAKASGVAEDLAGPDGVAIDFSDPNNWKIFAMGTGSFQFNDTESRQDAAEEATLTAKAALARFIKERVMVDEQRDKLTEEQSNKTKTKDGESSTASKKGIKTKLLTIRNSADEILSGLITLESTVKWDGDSGEVRVKLGQSEKTIAAVKKFVERTRGAIDGGTARAGAPVGGSSLPDKETRKSSSDF
jgi:hypothetical protein